MVVVDIRVSSVLDELTAVRQNYRKHSALVKERLVGKKA
jgi:hypothetical protein